MTDIKKPPFIAGNWKMHMTIPEAKDLVSTVVKASVDLAEAEIVVIPPFTALSEVRKVLEESSVQLGAQNLFWEEKGAFTGETSPSMLKDAGCQYVVVGHSERRQYFGETDASVNKKVKAALKSGLIPIVCIGESLEERERQKTISKVESQLSVGLEGLGEKDMRQAVIAYEPLWAIGTGKTATPAQAEEVHAFIRKKLAENYGKDAASCAIILYGGSVKPANAYSLCTEKDIDGFLVGGASLEAESFIQIIKEAVKACKEKT
ncbi:MAG: triose-phosphate isomerase [Candidatus Aminicenantales bacterium]